LICQKRKENLMARKAAVVIGIEKAHGLPPLPGAKNGARDFARWAEAAGFEVTEFVDEATPVDGAAIRKALRDLVDSREVEQLFLFFAGHGMSVGKEADFWILSAGTDDPAEIVNVSASLINARDCLIPHIVVIADACRTIANKKQIGGAVGASSIFPNKPPNPKKAQIDLFYSTLTGDPAQEVSDQAAIKAHGIFTTVFLDALTGKAAQAPINVDPDTGADVIYADPLKPYLEHQVPFVSGSIPGAAVQTPECRAESGHPHFIAQLTLPKTVTLTVQAASTDGGSVDNTKLVILRFPTGSAQPQPFRTVNAPQFSEPLPRGAAFGVEAKLDGYLQSPPSPQPVTMLLFDQKLQVSLEPISAVSFSPSPFSPPPSLVETYLLDNSGKRQQQAPNDGVYTVVSQDLLTGQTKTEHQILRADQPPEIVAGLTRNEAAEGKIDEVVGRGGRGRFETQTGLTVYGAPVVHAYSAQRPGFFPENDYWAVRGHIDGSMVLDLGHSRFAGLAMLQYFLGDLSVGTQGVDHLSYSPAPGSPFDVYSDEFKRQARRALVLAEAAARRGHFQAAVDQSLEIAGTLQEVARTSRQYKHYDPILGVFAAYAYHQAGDHAQIQSIISYFQQWPQPVPFDVVLLAGLDPQAVPYKVVPSFPLLTQGWFLLGEDASLHTAIANARRNLAKSLWTTIIGKSGRELGEAIERGELP
jgi:uncharacterized caspase-like protein